MDETTREALSKSFGPEAVRQKKGQGNRTMDYVSHGMVTKRLNDAAPGWHAEMIERWITETNGALHCLGGIMRLTIGDVTREEAGGPTRQGTLADDLKNTYSDCLKRCAMRFGVALDMWESAEENDEDAADPPPGRTLAEADLSGVGHGRRDTAHPPPAFTRPRETPAAAADNDLTVIRDAFAAPDLRKFTLHKYYLGATTLAELNQRADAAYGSGMDTEVLKAAYSHHHNRLAQMLAPAAYAG